MLTRAFRHLRRNVSAYLALFFALGAGGGYAIATTITNTIHGCVNKRTHALYIQKRCSRSQSPLVWNQAGAGQPFAAWGGVLADGFTGAGAQGISVQHVSAGTYDVTATPSVCARGTAAPTVTVDTGAPGVFAAAGEFPVAWETFSGRNTFTVYTGVVTGGSFTPTDEAFVVHVPCS